MKNCFKCGKPITDDMTKARNDWFDKYYPNDSKEERNLRIVIAYRSMCDDCAGVS